MLANNIIRSTTGAQTSSYVCLFCQTGRTNGRSKAIAMLPGRRRFLNTRFAHGPIFKRTISTTGESVSQSDASVGHLAEDVGEAEATDAPRKISSIARAKGEGRRSFKSSLKGTSSDVNNELKKTAHKIASVLMERVPEESETSEIPEKSTKSTKSKDSFIKNDLSDFSIKPLKIKQSASPPRLAHGLDRVLFNPGVCFLQDPRSRVYNFDPYLENIMPVSDFDFSALRDYITSSKDQALDSLARKLKAKYVGSTSSMTSVLSQFHYLISKWRPVNTKMMSQGFKVEYDSFARITRLPASIFLRYKDGVYAIDSDKEFDQDTILSMLGHSLEKLLTLDVPDYDKFHKDKSHKLPKNLRKAEDMFQYTMAENILMRSQLDAHDPRLPGSGMFDLKTRSVVSIRMRPQDTSVGAGYQIKTADGQWESFEREYYDMIRSAFLKYSLQVRIGLMDGIFVTYHNTERIFGFQYVSINELDDALHGCHRIGNLEFKYSLSLLSKALDIVTAKFPKQSLRIHFETRPTQSEFMYVFAEPISEEKIEEIQTSNRMELEKYAREVQKNLKKKKAEEQRAQEAAKKVVYGAEEDADPEVALDGENVEAEVNVAEAREAETQVEELDKVDKEQVAMGPVVESEIDSTDSLSVVAESELTADAAEGQSNESSSTTSTLLKEKEEEAAANSEDVAAKVEAIEEEGKLDETLETATSNTADEVVETATSNIADEVAETVTSNDAEAVSPTATKIDGDFNTLARSARSEIDAAAELEQFKEDYSTSDVAGFTLEVKNWVNSQAVLRPNALKYKDKWHITYSFKEITSIAQARNRYEQLRKRRITGLLGSDFRENNPYLQNLEKLSRDGRLWLEKQKQMDSRRKQVVFSPIRSGPRGYKRGRASKGPVSWMG